MALVQKDLSSVMDSVEFAAFVRILERPLGAFVAQMIPNGAVAEDVLQETFLVAWRERSRMPSEAQERRAWVYGIARNQALQALRKQRRGKRALDAVIAGGAGELSIDGIDGLAMRDLVADVLGPPDRSLFVLRYVHGFTAQSLAVMTGMQPATVRKRLERSSAALRRALESETPLMESEHGSSAVIA